MAKRFTDTTKYKKPFLRSLPGAYKLLWDFLYHDCDHAGIWIVDFETAQIYIGKDMPVEKVKAIELFNSDNEQRIIELDNGKRWFIPSFIDFQYGELRDNNKAHVAVINLLGKFGLLNHVRVGYNDPLNNNIKGEKRLKLFSDWENTCCYCGGVFSISNLQPDHVVPLNKNGSNSKSNVVCSCKDCNREKSDKNLFDFISFKNFNEEQILKRMSLRGILAPIKGAKEQEQYKEEEKEQEKEQEPKGVQGENDDWMVAEVEKDLTDAFKPEFFKFIEKENAYPNIDIKLQFKQFATKVRGSPDKYISHRMSGLRQAFQKQLRDAKPINNDSLTGKFKQISTKPRVFGGSLEGADVFK